MEGDAASLSLLLRQRELEYDLLQRIHNQVHQVAETTTLTEGTAASHHVKVLQNKVLESLDQLIIKARHLLDQREAVERLTLVVSAAPSPIIPPPDDPSLLKFRRWVDDLTAESGKQPPPLLVTKGKEEGGEGGDRGTGVYICSSELKYVQPAVAPGGGSSSVKDGWQLQFTTSWGGRVIRWTVKENHSDPETTVGDVPHPARIEILTDNYVPMEEDQVAALWEGRISIIALIHGLLLV